MMQEWSKSMFVSVVIPARNSMTYITQCLEQIRLQDYPHTAIEVIVADGGSDDRTPEAAEACCLNGIPVRVLRLKEKGRSVGLNAAIKAARGAAICRLDVRTRIGPDYIRRCVETLSRTGAANVGGVQVPHGLTLTQKAIGWAMSHPFGAGNAQFRVAKKSGFVDTIYPGFFRAEVFEKIGFFDERNSVLSEDSDLNQRIRAIGQGIYLDVNIQVGYEPRKTLFEHARLYFRYGVARAGNLRKHGELTSWRQIAAPSLVVVLLCLAVLTIFIPATLIILCGVIMVYMASDLAVSLWLVSKHKFWRAFPMLTVVFPVMHFGWGLGFWCGVLCPPKRDEHLSV